MSYLKYKILGIRTIDFSCLQEIDENISITFNTEYKFRLNKVDCLIGCISNFTYLQQNKVIMNLSLECVFAIEPEFFKSLREGDKYIVSADCLQYLATISVGTARGEIHARSEAANSPVMNLVLPPINLTEIIKTPSEFDA